MSNNKFRNFFNSLNSLRIEDIKLSNLRESLSSFDLHSSKIKDVLVNFVLRKRNRVIISSGLASILLLSILPSKIELVLNKSSTLSQYKTEDSLLEELQAELDSLKDILSAKRSLKDSISTLIPNKSEAEKSIPLILTNLLNAASLSLIEILPINELSYISPSDLDSLQGFDELSSGPPETEFLPEDSSDFENPPYEDGFDDSGSSSDLDFAADPFNSADSSSDLDFADDPFNSADSSDVSVGSPSGNSSLSALHYLVSLQGSPISIFEFFDSLHTTNILTSIGRVSFEHNSVNTNSQSSFTANMTDNVKLTFTLRVAVEPSSPLQTDNSTSVIEDTFSIDSIDRPSDDSSLLDDSETFPPLDDPSGQIPVLPLLEPAE